MYIAIRKIHTTSGFYVYSFGPTEENMGKLRIQIETGEIEILEEVPGDLTKFNSLRAIRKLTLHYRNREFPDVTCFAA